MAGSTAAPFFDEGNQVPALTATPCLTTPMNSILGWST